MHIFPAYYGVIGGHSKVNTLKTKYESEQRMKEGVFFYAFHFCVQFHGLINYWNGELLTWTFWSFKKAVFTWWERLVCHMEMWTCVDLYPCVSRQILFPVIRIYFPPDNQCEKYYVGMDNCNCCNNPI